LNKVAVYQK